MDKYVKMVLEAIERRCKAFPHLNPEKDQKTLLNDVYKLIWNVRSILSIGYSSSYRSYLEDPSMPKEIHKVMKLLLEGKITRKEAFQNLTKSISDYRKGIENLGYVFDEETDMFVKLNPDRKRKRRKLRFMFF